MSILKCICDEFVNQSSSFQNDSEDTRLKRIQNIIKNSPILINCICTFLIIRAIILFIERSSLGTTISFLIFIPIQLIIVSKLSSYIKLFEASTKRTFRSSINNIENFENKIGFYSSMITAWALIMIPFTIYFEEEKFDKGIQFMMTKILLNLIDIILMQPKKHAQFVEIAFTIIYTIILSMKCISYVNLFFSVSTSIATYFIFYIAEQFNNSYFYYKKKERILKFNDEILKMIDEPIVLLQSSLNQIVFKNESYEHLQKAVRAIEDIEVLRILRNENNETLLKVLQDIEKATNSNLLKSSSSFNMIFTYQQYGEKKIIFHIKRVKKQLKNLGEDVIALYFHDIGNEIEMKALQENAVFSNLMLYSLSHQFRTPLNGMQGILHLIKNKIESNYFKHIKIALGCSKFLVNQINCVLDYTQILKREFKLHLEYVNINDFFKNIKKICKSILMNKKGLVKIIINISSTISSKVIIDKERVKQIILNLMTNSIKYTDKGHIILSSSINDNNELEISVSDTGIGFSQEQISIFSDYDSQKTIPNMKENSTFPGYKLRLCQILSHKLKSHLKISSVKDRGSTFSFSIALRFLKKYIEKDIYKRSPSGTLLDEDICPKTNFKNYQFTPNSKNIPNLNLEKFIKNEETINRFIIIADDIELNRFVISGMIKKLEFHNILEAVNGKEALEIARDKASKLEDFIIFMDIDMPILNVIESTKQIREFSKKPIIAVTAFVGEEMRSKAIESGMNDFLTKPISFSKIRGLLKNYNFI